MDKTFLPEPTDITLLNRTLSATSNCLTRLERLRGPITPQNLEHLSGTIGLTLYGALIGEIMHDHMLTSHSSSPQNSAQPTSQGVNTLPAVVRTFYDARMSCPTGSYSPSGEKPAAVVADWLEHKLIEVVGFSPVTDDDLALAHDCNYIRGIFAGEIENGHHNFSPEVAESTRWTVGSMVAAARVAYQAGSITCSPSSGFHHAHYDHNHGFCTFNGLIVAARKVIDEFNLDSVGILDCDWHHGDGTQDIINRLSLREQIKHYSSGAQWLRSVAEYFEWLEVSVNELVEMEVDLILYQAGADAHRKDPLGGLLNNRELEERDQFVFEQARKKQIPVAWNLAGGYQRDESGSIEKVLKIHRQTMLAASESQ